MRIKAWINEEAEEFLMNLVSQGYYAEAQNLIVNMTDCFKNSLYLIAKATREGDVLRW